MEHIQDPERLVIREVTASELPAVLREVLDAAALRGRATAVTRYGELAAYIVPASWYQAHRDRP